MFLKLVNFTNNSFTLVKNLHACLCICGEKLKMLFYIGLHVSSICIIIHSLHNFALHMTHVVISSSSFFLIIFQWARNEAFMPESVASFLFQDNVLDVWWENYEGQLRWIGEGDAGREITWTKSNSFGRRYWMVSGSCKSQERERRSIHLLMEWVFFLNNTAY